MFKIGKAVVIDNYKFDQPLFVKMAYSSVSGNALTMTPVSPTDSQVRVAVALNRGDILVGTNASGSTEHLTVDYITGATSYSTLSPYTINVVSAPTLTYTAGDTIYGYGTGWPHKWNHYDSSRGRFVRSTIKPAEGGIGKDYCFRAENASGASGYLTSDEWQVDQLEDYCYYRVGMWMKQNIGSTAYGSRLFINDGLKDGSRSVYSQQYPDWYELTGTSLLSEDLAARSEFGHIRIEAANASPGATEVWWDSVYAEHIRGQSLVPTAETRYKVTAINGAEFPVVGSTTDFTVGNTVTIWGLNDNETAITYALGRVKGLNETNSFIAIDHLTPASSKTWAPGARIEEKNDGVYEFAEPPDLPTEWFKTSGQTKFRNASNRLVKVNPSGWGERTTKYSFRLRFSNVAYTFFKKLRLFEEHCERGGLLNIHELADYFPDMERKFLQGSMELTGLKHDIWNQEKVSFGLLFEEA